ncbi:MAG: hypothetical protein H6727_09010 [Myxococcales bacterium]|nr:hypothetical protein [Myxococcales bacterium]
MKAPSVFLQGILFALFLFAFSFPMGACGPTNTEKNTESSPERDASTHPEAKEQTADALPSESTESQAPDLTEPQPPESTEPTAEKNPDCQANCTVTARCAGADSVERCDVQNGCVIWQPATPCDAGKTCKDGLCVAKTCDGPGQCGTGNHCEGGVCTSNDNCCTEGAPRCTQLTEQRCVKGDDGCGKWEDVKACSSDIQTRQECYLNQCVDCYQRECGKNIPCCAGSTCLYGYCLQQCDESKGDINNPACKTDEFCFSLSSGQPAICFPDATEPKGAPCSIVKICQVGLSCVDIGQGLRCYSDCDLNQCAVANPNCTSSEQCVPAAGATLGNICVPLQTTPAKLYEACNASTPCESCGLCVGENAASTHCLTQCNPSDANPNCPQDYLCAAYDASKPTKGVCLQRCNTAGTKDICSYGSCREKNGERYCL